MALAVEYLVQQLSTVVAREADLLIKVKEKIGWIETEFRLMVANQKSVEAQHQLSEDEKEWVERTRGAIRRAEDLIETYAKKASVSKMAAIYKKPIHLIERRNLSKEMDRLKSEIIQVRQGWRYVVFANSLSSHEDHLASSSQGLRSGVMAKLDSAMEVRLGVPLLGDVKWVRDKLIPAIKWVRDELSPLHSFLQEIDNEQLVGTVSLGERQKIWIKELNGIFHYIDDSFVDSRSEGAHSFSIVDHFKRSKIVPKIQYRILQLYRVYYTYGFGEILVNNGSRSIFPRIRMSTPIPKADVILTGTEDARITPMFETEEPQITYLSWLTPGEKWKMLELDLKLMKALRDDTEPKRRGLDMRATVWLDQVDEASSELTSFIESCGNHTFSNRVFLQTMMSVKLKEIRYEICYLALRRMMYGIGSSLGEEEPFKFPLHPETKLYDPTPYKSPIFTSPRIHFRAFELLSSIVANLISRVYFPRRRIKSVTKHVDLMKALLEDANRMKKLDARLKVWVQEVQYVAREANSALELYSGSSIYKRAKAVNGIKRIYRRILTLSAWKNNYDIGDVKSSKPAAGTFNHSLEEADQHSSETTNDEVDFIRREIKMMQALDCDAVKIDDLDGTSKAWVEEIRDVVKDAKSLISRRYRKGVGSELELVKDRIMHVSEIKVAYGIELTQKLGVLQQVSNGSRVIFTASNRNSSLDASTSDAISNSPVILRQLPPQSRDVPFYLRRFIYFFVLFPANFEVPTRRLIALWVAEGLTLSQNEENESLEQIAECYLEDLIKRGVVHVTKRKLNGKVKTCQLCDGTRDGWLRNAREARFLQGEGEIIPRLVDHHGHDSTTSDSCFIQIHGNSRLKPSYQDVISFVSFDTREGSKPGEDIGVFLKTCISAGCFQRLRTLDLERVFRPKLTKELRKLSRLRYLGLRWTCLENLPKYVSELLNLQVLDVKNTNINVLPKSIWRMQYLRHLYLSGSHHTRFDGRPSTISLNELQTLWGAFVDESTFVKQGLDTLLNVRKLGLSCRASSSSEPSLMPQQLQAVSKWIVNLEHLETLRLKSHDYHGNAANLHLDSLESNEKLSVVYLLGILQPTVVEKFPKNLIDITLSGSELRDNPLRYLEELPELLILRLLSRSVVDRKMHCSKNGFRKLRVLKIWKLENLEEWEVQAGALPSLEDLEIRACGKLSMLSSSLKHVETLRLTAMPEEFINKTRECGLWAKIEVDFKQLS